MSTISWNCQGLGLPWKVQFLKELTRQTKPTFIFLCETISRKDKMEWIRNVLGYEGMIVVEPEGRSGGLALLWREENQASLLSMSKHHIDVETKVSNMLPWRLTGLYGEPNRNHRKKTWDLLRHLARDSNLPWCTIGDLNNIIAQNEKRG